MLMAGYCSHGDSRLCRASVTLKRLSCCFCHIKHGTGEANILRFVSVLLRFPRFVIDMKHTGLGKRGWLLSNVTRSMSKRGYSPHGGVFQGMGAAAGLGLCCLLNADTQGTILAPARGMLLFVGYSRS